MKEEEKIKQKHQDVSQSARARLPPAQRTRVVNSARDVLISAEAQKSSAAEHNFSIKNWNWQNDKMAEEETNTFSIGSAVGYTVYV